MDRDDDNPSRPACQTHENPYNHNTAHEPSKSEHVTLPFTEPTSNHSSSSTSPSSPQQSQKENPTSTLTRILRYISQPISQTSPTTSTLLLLLAFATGINDAATFIDYHLFVSNQTGNTIFLGVGALSHDSIFDLGHVGVSLSLFCIGGFVSGQLSRFLLTRSGRHKRTRWWVAASNLFQTVLAFIATALRRWYAVVNASGPHHGNPESYSVVALLAFSSGMQVAMAKGLGVAEIPTGMITSAWIDLVADEEIWAVWRKNRPRDRRLAFVLCIFAGGFVGAAAHVYCAPALPLLLAAILKAVVTLGFLFGGGADDGNERAVTEKKV